MAKPKREKIKLTREFIAQAVCEPGRDRTVWRDVELPGYGLEVTKTGHKSLFVESRIRRGRSAVKRQITLKTLDAKKGRHEAKILLGQMAQGYDLLHERRAEAAKATGTLRAVIEEYLKREANMTRHADGRVTFKAGCDLRSGPASMR